ncbi:MAG: hypothetical protein ACRENA_09310 [Vulcanimicrobiaceae bacterium]
MRFATFVLRFLSYAIVLGIAYGIAQDFWVREGLDRSESLAGYHSIAIAALTIAPLVLAVVAIVARPLALFVLFYLVGAVLTAPFALAHAAG